MMIRWKWLMAAALCLMMAACSNSNSGSNNVALAGVNATTIDQKQVSFDALRQEGKVVVVNFWATSCSTCKKEMPKLVEMYQSFAPKGVAYLGVAMFYDNPEYVKNYVAAQQLPFPITWDSDKQLAEKFGGIMGTPTTFIIDKKGNVAKRYVGEPKWDEFYEALNKALTES